MRQVVYCEYYGWTHLFLLMHGWQEHHCVIADGGVLIKMVKP